MAKSNVVDLNSIMSVIVFCVNSLNTPIKSVMWSKLQNPIIHCLKEPHFKYMDRKSESRVIEKLYNVNTN